jgi:CRISPR/Cas system CMR subunit Cmr4 (Cas7 group RAMP superfamily)
MTKIRSCDKVVRDSASQNTGKVRVGDAAPAFATIRAGDKVVRDAASQNTGKVRLGDAAPIFRPSK